MTKAIVRKDVKKFTVKRSKWFRGKGISESSLLNVEGKMCCLGFYGLACGLRPRDIRNHPTPSEMLHEKDSNIWETFLVKDSDDGQRDSKNGLKLMEINDNEKISDANREEKITKEFLKQGIKVKFVD